MKRLFFRVKFLFVTLVRLFLSVLNGGQSCVICGESSFLAPLCKKCNSRYFDVKKSLEKSRCQCCGKELISTKMTCMQCRENRVLTKTDKVIPLFSYRLWNKELLFLWKIKGLRALSFEFARMVAQALRLSGIEVIVPVPPRKGKIKKNGWDQIDELCQFLEFWFGFKTFPVLVRNTKTQQKKLNRSSRLETIESAYSVIENKKLQKELKRFNGLLPEKVCVIDDVCTTGATLECCAGLLKDLKIKTVIALTLFTVD